VLYLSKEDKKKAKIDALFKEKGFGFEVYPFEGRVWYYILDMKQHEERITGGRDKGEPRGNWVLRDRSASSESVALNEAIDWVKRNT
jgi:hypothetical protein